MQITQETLTWPFKDPEWRNKFIVGSALALASSAVPILGLVGIFAIYGYSLIVMRAVMGGGSPALPKWDKYGELIVDGLKATLAAVGYFVPGFLAFCCAYVFLFATIIATANASPSASAGTGVQFLLGQLGYFVLLFGGIMLFYLGTIPTPVASGQYARTREIVSGYRLREIWAILRANLVGYLLGWAVYLGLLMALSYLLVFVYATIILCFLLPVLLAPLTFYMALLWATVFGAAYREGIEKNPSLESAVD